MYALYAVVAQEDKSLRDVPVASYREKADADFALLRFSDQYAMPGRVERKAVAFYVLHPSRDRMRSCR